MQDTGKIVLQLVYHREQVDIDPADVVVDKQPAVYREVVAGDSRQDVAYARIYSRILEMCTPVRISGEDRR